MAHWSTDLELSRSVVALLRELEIGGYQTVLVSAAEAPGPIGRVCTWAPDSPSIPGATTVLRRANVGYDFGSWAAVLEAFPGIRRARRVLLINDSLIGPFSSLAPILADFEASATPVWGLSSSRQHRPHIQSFFIGYRDGVLDSPAIRAFWKDIRVESRKAKIVRYDELGLAEVLDEAGLSWRTMSRPDPGGSPNPTLGDPVALLAAGFPFVKANADESFEESELSAWWPTGRGPGPSSLSLRERIRFAAAVEGMSGLVAAVGRLPERWRP